MGGIFKPFLGEGKSQKFRDWTPKTVNEPKTGDLSECISEEELNQLKQAAFDQAYQEGLKQAQTDVRAIQRDLNKLMEKLIQPLKLLDREVSEQLTDIILLVCRHCLQSELSMHPEKILNILEEVKKYIPAGASKRKLYLSTSDISTVRKMLMDINSEIGEEDLVEDEMLSPGEYRYVTETAELDGRLQARLDNILDRVDDVEGKSND